MKEKNTACRKVMVVDDAEIDRFLAERIITKFDFAEEVITVESAMDALKYLISNGENPQALPDVILLDINMPEMSGFDFLEEYGQLPQTIKKKCIIVMLSSSLLPEDHNLALSSPYVCDFIGKPLNATKLEKLKTSCFCQPADQLDVLSDNLSLIGGH